MKEDTQVYTKRITFEIGDETTRVPRWVYVSLIKAEKICLVDTGTAGNFEEILQFCADHDVDVREIDLIVNTHCHPDHIGGNLLFEQANPSIEFCAHRLAVPEIEDIDRQYGRRPLPGFYRLIAGPVKIQRVLEDGDDLAIGTEARVLHTPGHSSGSISLHLPKEDLLIIGDSVPGRTDVPIYEDPQLLRSTIDRLAGTAASRVLSAFDGDCGPISEVAELGRGVLQRVDDAVRAVARERSESGTQSVGEIEPTVLCRTVLDRLGFAKVAPLPIIVNSIAAHLKRQ